MSPSTIRPDGGRGYQELEKVPHALEQVAEIGQIPCHVRLRLVQCAEGERAAGAEDEHQHEHNADEAHSRGDTHESFASGTLYLRH